MTDNTNALTHFDPADHIQQINTKQGLKPYLDPRKATTWFYHDNPAPSGKIITNVIRMEPTILVRAEIWIGGEIVATGHADTDGNSNTLKKIESAAIRRALANAGYGTDQVMARFAKTIPVEEVRNMLGSGKEKAERRLGAETATDKRNPIAILTAGLEENGTTFELAAVALGIKDANDIEQWRQFGTTPKAIAAEVNRANAKPFGAPKKFNGNAPATDSQTAFEAIPAMSAALQGQLDR